jgi:AcrR family transcriptional regulator
MLDAALAIIARDGMAGLSIAAVSSESGVSNGALYHRFGDRHGLLVAAQDRFLSGVESDWLTAAVPLRSLHDPEKLLTRLTQTYLRLFSERRALFHAFMITEWADPDLRARGAQTTRVAAREIVGLLTERFNCTPEAADTAYRIVFGQAIQLVLSVEEDTSVLCVEPKERIRHLVRGLRALLQP